MMAFLKHCDEFKAFNKMPNKVYVKNSKHILKFENNNSSVIEELLREIDTMRAIEMPALAPAPAAAATHFQLPTYLGIVVF